jgi:hypothetical protein
LVVETLVAEFVVEEEEEEAAPWFHPGELLLKRSPGVKYLLGWERSMAGGSDEGGDPSSCSPPALVSSLPPPPPPRGPMCLILLMPPRLLSLASLRAASRFTRAALSRLRSHMHQMPQHRVKRKNRKYLSSMTLERKGVLVGGVGGAPWEVALGNTVKDMPHATRVKLLAEGLDDTGHCRAMQQGER